jgi:hypothetical protein
MLKNEQGMSTISSNSQNKRANAKEDSTELVRIEKSVES